MIPTTIDEKILNNNKTDYEIIKPLPSIYAGTYFRSRLEARWAAYFDMIGVTWQYEPESYDLNSGNSVDSYELSKQFGMDMYEVAGPSLYTPDFLCCDELNHGFFVEIKPNKGDLKKVTKKLSKLAKSTKKPAFCLVGPPSLEEQWACDENGEECGVGVIFCSYAFKKKQWGIPYYGEYHPEFDFLNEDEYEKYAANMRFEKGVAIPPFKLVSNEVVLFKSPYNYLK